MLSRFFRTAAVLLLVSCIVSCGRATPTALAPLPASPSSLDAYAPLPIATVSAAETRSGAGDVSPATVIVLSQPPKSSGGLIPSAWRDPDGSDTDRWIWENFGFENTQIISEVRWRGGYDPAKRGSGGPVNDFTVDIYPSIPSGTEPKLADAPLVHYRVGGNAKETPADVLGGVQTYEYRFVLPAPFEAAAWTPYWVQIEAFQAGDPDWGLSVGSLGDARHFRGSQSSVEGYYFQLVPNDAALEWLAPSRAGPTPGPEVPASLEEIAAMLEDLPPAEEVPINAEGVQQIMLVVSRSGYTPVHFAVKSGIPVRLIFRQLGYVPGGNELRIRWGSRQETYLVLESPTDKKLIEFTPQEPGEYKYSCPHDWYWGVMTVQE